MDSFPTFVLGLASVGVAGFVAWTISSVFKLRSELHELEMRVANGYVKRDAMDDFRRELRSLRTLTIEIAAKLGVPVHLE